MSAPLPTAKTCTKCGEVKLLEEFNRRAASKDGRQPSCRICQRAKDRAHYVTVAEDRKAYQRAYYEQHSGYVLGRNRQWREENSEHVRDQRGEYRQANRERIRTYQRAYRKSNPETVRVWQRTYRLANPDVGASAASRRRARVRNAPVVEDVSRATVWDRDAGICHICKLPADPDNWHLEHIKPLSRGGEHSYANTAVSHPECNLRKGTKDVAEIR